MKLYTSTEDMRLVFAEILDAPLRTARSEPDEDTFSIDPHAVGQPMFGFGGNLTDTEVYHLTRMKPATRKAVLKALFDPEEGAGWSFLRLPLGSSDWERNLDFYTYDDMPPGEKDWELARFSIRRDEERGYFDLLREVSESYPEVRYVGTVWAVPGWMKSTDNILGGIFLPEYTEVYARYLRLAVQAFERRKVHLDAVTIQNEPMSSDFPNACRQSPATRFTWRLERDVLVALRREFDTCGITTQIWAYDHNYDMANIFVDPLLKDEAARRAIDGIAFHAYRGDPRVLERYAREAPDLALHSIEKTVADPNGMDEVLRQLRFGARSYLLWSFLQDNYGGPHQLLGGPFKYLHETRKGAVYCMVSDPDEWHVSATYALFGIISRFVRRGMRVVGAKYGHRRWITQASFADEAGNIVSILVNQTGEPQRCVLRIGNLEQELSVPPRSVSACVIDAKEREAPEPRTPAAPEKSITEPPRFDMTPVMLWSETPLVAGQEALFCVTLKNVGNASTPVNMTAAVDFLLDGDFRIARAYGTIPPLNPGETCVLRANTPLPDVAGTGVKTTWTAVPGVHELMALLNIGNCWPPEENEYNNRLCVEAEIQNA